MLRQKNLCLYISLAISASTFGIQPTLAQEDAPTISTPAQAAPAPGDASADAGTTKSGTLKTLPTIVGVTDPFQKILYSTLKSALEADDEMKTIDKQLADLRSKSKPDDKVTADELLKYKGSLPVRDVLVAILDRPDTAASMPALDLKWERKIDQKYLTVLRIFFQMAGNMSNADLSTVPEYTQAKAELAKLVGDPGAQNVEDRLVSLKQQLNAGTAPNTGTVLTPLDFVAKRDLLISQSSQRDPVMQQLFTKIEGFTVNPGRNKDVNTTLSVMSMLPFGVGTVADLAQCAYDMTTSSDEAKVELSVYLAKRIQVRREVISAAADQVLHSWDIARITNNPMLLAFSLSTMGDLSGPETVSQVAGDAASFWPYATGKQPQIQLEASGK